jgi:hypothetical protein
VLLPYNTVTTARSLPLPLYVTGVIELVIVPLGGISPHPTHFSKTNYLIGWTLLK